MSSSCPFCQRVSTGEFVAESALAVAFADGFPLSDGHTLIVPKRHEADFFALTPDEQAEIWRLAAVVRHELQTRRVPDGYNVGVNIGAAAGQTVAHAHLHLIPRYRGDVNDPRGGVRWVVPAKAAYWDDER